MTYNVFGETLNLTQLLTLKGSQTQIATN